MGYMIQTLSTNPVQLTGIICDSTTQEWFFGSVGALDNLPMDDLKAEICVPNFEQEMLNELVGLYDIQNYVTDVSFPN